MLLEGVPLSLQTVSLYDRSNAYPRDRPCRCAQKLTGQDDEQSPVLKASAPGSLMLLGEYGVLQHHRALVCAVDRRIAVTLTPRKDRSIYLHSCSLGNYTTDLASVSIEKPFQFVLGAISLLRAKLTCGFELDIQAGFSDRLGLGSSAAVTAATLAVLLQWLGKPVTLLEMVRLGKKVVRQVQGVGSGADLAAAVFGGIVGYTPYPLAVEKFFVSYPLLVWYSGHKVSSTKAIKQVQSHFAPWPVLFRKLCQSIGQCAEEGIQRVRTHDWDGLGIIMNAQQGLMEALGVSSSNLRYMVETLRMQPGILGAKISGSGFGDCVVALGYWPTPELVSEIGQSIPAAMTLQGTYCEKV